MFLRPFDVTHSNDPVEGKRHLLTGSLVELDSAASPSGWHTVPALSVSVPEVYYDDTRGNNVVAQDNIDGGNNWLHNYRPHGGEDMAFDFHLGLPKAGTPLSPKSECRLLGQCFEDSTC